jgi:hypothetical protein
MKQKMTWLTVPGEIAANRLRYGWPGRPNLADKVELIRALHSAPDGSYDSDEVRTAIAAEIERRAEVAKMPLNQIPYGDFLETEYWYTLCDHLKFLIDYTCQRCRVRPFPLGRGLNVHHKTYAHRGFEYPDHLSDLEVLCKACHEKRHKERA